MNEIKSMGLDLEDLICRLRGQLKPVNSGADMEPARWIAIGKTHLQQGLMALTRSVAKPDFF